MNFGGMPGDVKSQISYDKWKEEEIRRTRLCWDELSINTAPRKTGRGIFTPEPASESDTKGVAGQVRQICGGSDTTDLIFCHKRRR